MSLISRAQLSLITHEPLEVDDEEVILFTEKPSEAEVVALTPEHREEDDVEMETDEEGSSEALEVEELAPVAFKLSKIPGSALADQDLEVSEVEINEVPHPEVEMKSKPKDLWDWSSQGHANFLDWAMGMLHNIPKHSGKDVGGCERAASYLKRLLNEFSKAMQSDFEGCIDADRLEALRAEAQ